MCVFFRSHWRQTVDTGTKMKANVPAPRFNCVHLKLRSCDYSTHVDGLLPASLCLATLLSSEQCSHLVGFRL